MMLNSIWGQTKGYVFVCSIDWAHGRKFNPGAPFHWPDQRQDLVNYADRLATQGHDVYFTPAMFSKPQRKAEHVKPQPRIWADVDDGPIDVVRATKPTALWETSPGRWQAVWKVDAPVDTADGLARAVSHILKCDPGGWDATQLLRLPGYVSHKRDEPFKVGEPELNTPQRLIDLVRKVYSSLPWSEPRHSGQLSARQAVGDRSKILFDLAKHLLSNGLSPEDTTGLLAHTVWNKWPTIKALRTDVDRIASRLPQEPEEEPVADRAHLTVTPLTELADLPRPRWLVNGIIAEGSCGFISAPPKRFKSWIALDMAMSVATGGYALGVFSCKRRPVLFVEAEDNASLLAKRLSIVADARYPDYNPRGRLAYENGRLVNRPPKPAPLHFVVAPPLNFGPEFYEDLEDLIDRYHVALCIYDTLSMLTTANVNDVTEMYTQVLSPLKAIARRHNTAQLIIHHTRKASKDAVNTGGAAMLGSVGLHAWSDNSIYLTDAGQGQAVMTVESKATATTVYNLNKLDTIGGWTPVVESKDVPVRNWAGDDPDEAPPSVQTGDLVVSLD